MANKIDPLQALTSTYGAVTALNANFTKIATALQNTLSRDGSSPNQMLADVDMNHFNILNIGNASDLKGAKGDTGINGGTASNLTIGLFTGCAGQDLTSGGTKPAPDVVVTSGYRTVGKGGARYVKDAAVDAAFVTAHPGWSFRDSQGNGYRLSEDQILRFDMFGAYGDCTSFAPGQGTDDYPQWLIAKDFIQFYKETHGNGYYKSVPAMYFGRHIYRFSNYIDLTEGAYDLRGAGPAAWDRAGNTVLLFNATCGIIAQSWDSSGVSGTTTNTPKGAGYTSLTDIMVYSSGGTVGAAQHGFLFKCPVIAERCYAMNFGGHGFYINADHTVAGNANCGKLINCGAGYIGMSGLKINGQDANAFDIVGFNAQFCIQYGIHDASALGNHYYGYHLATNGQGGSGPDWRLTSTAATAHYLGHHYAVIPGQATWASANAPSGTTASNTGWRYVEDGGVTGIWQTWVPGLTFTEGGAFLIEGASNKAGVFGGYMESDTLPGYCTSPRALLISGGFSSWSGVGAILAANGGRLVAANGLGVGANVDDGIEVTLHQLRFGANCYLECLDTETMALRGPLGNSVSLTRNGTGHQHPFSMGFPTGSILGADSGGYTGIASAMPNSGSYTQGAWVRNRIPSISAGKVLLGWLRLTTGAAHVSGTDWTPVYGTTS